MWQWLVGISLAVGLGWGMLSNPNAIWTYLNEGGDAHHKMAEAKPLSLIDDGKGGTAISNKIPWGATQDQIIHSLGEADVKQPGILGYLVSSPGPQKSMMVGYHFDEDGNLFGVSLVYPKPNNVQEPNANYMSMVSELGQPDGYSESTHQPIWLLQDGTLVTVLTGEKMQAILLLKGAQKKSVLVNPSSKLI